MAAEGIARNRGKWIPLVICGGRADADRRGGGDCTAVLVAGEPMAADGIARYSVNGLGGPRIPLVVCGDCADVDRRGGAWRRAGHCTRNSDGGMARGCYSSGGQGGAEGRADAANAYLGRNVRTREGDIGEVWRWAARALRCMNVEGRICSTSVWL